MPHVPGVTLHVHTAPPLSRVAALIGETAELVLMREEFDSGILGYALLLTPEQYARVRAEAREMADPPEEP